MNNNDLQLSYQKPFALYVHIPFCSGKCNYCDFYSERYSHSALEGFYQGIHQEIELYASLIDQPVLKTIYIGGGTPSLIKPTYLVGLIKKIRQHFDFSMLKEISLEANPGSITEDKLLKYREAGINRISLGVQSFNDKELSFLGRKHTVKQALEAVELLQGIFQNYNLDLIFAIPGQSLESWQKTLKQVLSFQAPHLSIYNLQIEEGTPLANMLAEGKIKAVDDDLDAQMYLLARELFNSHHYKQYEISNFSRKGFDSIHNQIYWHYQPYLGMGPAAVSFDGRIRFTNKADLRKYISSLTNSVLPVENIERLSIKEQISEMIFMGLRLTDGISLTGFNNRFAVDFLKLYQLEIEDCLSKGLIEIKDKHIRLSEKGLLLGNEVFMKFLK